MNATQQLPEYGTLDVANPELDWRYGLYTGSAISQGANTLYQFFLQKYLFPMVENQSEVTLRKTMHSGQSEEVYAALKLYLMLTGEGKFDRQYMIEHVTQDWQKSGKLSLTKRRVFSSVI